MNNRVKLDVHVVSAAHEVSIDTALKILQSVKTQDPGATIDLYVYHVVTKSKISLKGSQK